MSRDHGDDGAWRDDPRRLGVLWEHHRRWIATVLLAHASREHDVDDLLQDVAVAFVRDVADLRDGARLRPWLRTVALNAVRQAGRRAAGRRERERALEETDGEIVDPRAGGHVGAELRDEAARVLALVRALPAEYGEPLLLRALGGMSQADVADVLDVPVTTVETRLVRARRMLAERLARPVGSAPRPTRPAFMLDAFPC